MLQKGCSERQRKIDACPDNGTGVRIFSFQGEGLGSWAQSTKEAEGEFKTPFKIGIPSYGQTKEFPRA